MTAIHHAVTYITLYSIGWYVIYPLACFKLYRYLVGKFERFTPVKNLICSAATLAVFYTPTIMVADGCPWPAPVWCVPKTFIAVADIIVRREHISGAVSILGLQLFVSAGLFWSFHVLFLRYLGYLRSAGERKTFLQ